ncbi:hypothetical protein JW897_17300 [Chromobacterium alkanivorans]|uniref:hypothetical protein n=1 Tax=Chromobacterium alkanivorans TaxID=1071719 RepID=UPI001967ED2C|nr:hypothetical protein [Chromobacterium alkanivorans]MBN3005494.1 hypothetical protein [Chromobacterium alkanivorans]
MSDPRLLALASELKALGIPASCYSLGHQRDERTCLVFFEGKWLVYYSERGAFSELSTFDSFEDAKANFIGRLQ